MSYTLKTLIERLTELQSEHGPDTEIYMSRDQEGNGYNPLTDADPSIMNDQDKYEVQMVHPQDIEDGEYDEEQIAEFRNVIVLWP